MRRSVKLPPMQTVRDLVQARADRTHRTWQVIRHTKGWFPYRVQPAGTPIYGAWRTWMIISPNNPRSAARSAAEQFARDIDRRLRDAERYSPEAGG